MIPFSHGFFRLALPPGGVRVPAAPGGLRPILLLNDAGIPCRHILSMQGDMTARLWSGPTTDSTLLLECGQTITNGVSVVNGQPVSFAAPGQTSEVWLQVLAPGTGFISYGFAGRNTAEGISFTDTLPVTTWGLELDDGGAAVPWGGAPNGLAAYVPGSKRTGFADGTNAWETVIDADNAQGDGELAILGLRRWDGYFTHAAARAPHSS